MRLRAWLVQGRAFLLAVGVVCWLFGCGGDDGDGGSGNNPGNNGGNSGSNNGGGNADYVTLGGKKWMKKNLNVQTADSWCYGDDASNCAKYGRLYTWEAAKTACPLAGSGWRLPDTSDWNRLVEAAGGSSVAGDKLKSQTGWNGYYGVVNEDAYGFSALPGGYRYPNGGFNYAGESGHWWTATADGSGGQYFRVMDYSSGRVREVNGCERCGQSVRCVGD
jgi:uncharacterized protein (TIGR02145 family)